MKDPGILPAALLPIHFHTASPPAACLCFLDLTFPFAVLGPHYCCPPFCSLLLQCLLSLCKETSTGLFYTEHGCNVALGKVCGGAYSGMLPRARAMVTGAASGKAPRQQRYLQLYLRLRCRVSSRSSSYSISTLPRRRLGAALPPLAAAAAAAGAAAGAVTPFRLPPRPAAAAAGSSSSSLPPAAAAAAAAGPAPLLLGPGASRSLSPNSSSSAAGRHTTTAEGQASMVPLAKTSLAGSSGVACCRPGHHRAGA